MIFERNEPGPTRLACDPFFGARFVKRGLSALTNRRVFWGLFVGVIVAALPYCVAQAEQAAPGPTPALPAPDIEVQKLLNAPDGAGTSWEALRGKVVVLEFWSTYCGPCLANIPLTNKLQAAFANDPVVFIHITDEDETTVRKFLEGTRINGWIGLDNDRATLRAYGVTGLPRSAVVGKDARFLGWTSPSELVNEPEILKQVLESGSSPALRDTQPSPVDPLRGVARAAETSFTGNSLCDIVIRRSIRKRSKLDSGGDSRGNWYFDHPLLTHISWFWGVPRPRIVAEATLPEGTYDIVAISDKASSAGFTELVRRLIELTFELSVTRDKRVMEAYVLRPLPKRQPELPPSPGTVYTDEDTGLYAPNKAVLQRMKAGERFFFAICPLATLADKISGEINKPVVAELEDLPTRHDGFYTICFPYENGNVKSFIEALEKHVGLTVTPAWREVDVLVIRRAGNQARNTVRP